MKSLGDTLKIRPGRTGHHHGSGGPRNQYLPELPRGPGGRGVRRVSRPKPTWSGFLRNYSDFLGLEPDKIVGQFKQLQTQRGAHAHRSSSSDRPKGSAFRQESAPLDTSRLSALAALPGCSAFPGRSMPSRRSGAPGRRRAAAIGRGRFRADFHSGHPFRHRPSGRARSVPATP
jgi:hypothetical protein